MTPTYMQIGEHIQNAITYHLPHPKVTIAQIARDFEVPYQRLVARIKGRIGRHRREHINTRLTASQEAALCSYVERLDDRNLAAQREQIRGAANSILKEAYTHTIPALRPPEPPTVGKCWVARFVKRYEYCVVRQKTLDAERCGSEDPAVIENARAPTGEEEIPVARRLSHGHRCPVEDSYQGLSRDAANVEEACSRDVEKVARRPPESGGEERQQKAKISRENGI